MSNTPDRTSLSRQRALRAGVGASLAGLAGCLGSGTSADEARATSRPALGDEDAPVTVEVFEDFACPHCRRFNQEVAGQLKTDYVDTGDIVYQHYDLPIPVDERVSWRASSAARSVLGQIDHQIFFKYASLLFENQSSLGPEVYSELAAEVGVDGETARTAATEERYRETVDADREEARDRGIEGTPAVFVNGDNLADRGRLDYETVSGQIESRL